MKIFIIIVTILGILFQPVIQYRIKTRSKKILAEIIIVVLTIFAVLSGYRLQEADIKSLQGDIIVLKDYSDAASLNALGKPYDDGDIEFNTPISTILEGTWTIKNNKAVMSRDESAEIKYREVMKKFPKFPFGYYFMALLLKDRGDATWQEYAQKAITILENTTSITGHHSNHDDVLRRLKVLLKEQ